MATIANLLSYADITGMTVGDSKQVILGIAHKTTGYFLGYDGFSVVSIGSGFDTEDTMQASANTVTYYTDYVWTLTKYSDTQYTIFVNGYNPSGTTDTAVWSTTTMYYTIGEVTSLGSYSNMTSGYSLTNLIRFTNPSTYYLNSQSSPSALKFATGTGEWSVWQVYEVSGDPVTTTITTNYGTYAGDINNVLDTGDTTTYFWSNEAQASGKYVQIEFSDYVDLTRFVTYSSNSGDYPHSTNALQVSSDGTTWSTIGSFSDAQTTTFSGITTAVGIKYVRIYATGSTTNWLYLNTITMSYNYNPSPSSLYTVAIKTSEDTWTESQTIYQKQGNCWWKIDRTDLIARLSSNTIVKGSYTRTTNDEYLDKRLLVFEDDFDEGELDTSVWTIESGYCRNANALAYYCASALTFEDSNIVITATRTSGLPNAKKADGTTWALSWTSGSIQSQDKFTFQYGRVQAKIKLPKLKGSFPAFWLFGNDRKFSEYHGDGTILTETGTEWSECGEIDIMEQTSTNSNTTWNLWQSQSGAGSSYQNGSASVDPSEWHIYEIEWTPTSMTFMVDGNAVSSTIDITVSQGQAYVNDLFFIILNLNIGADGGTPDSSCNEMKMYCDWIRVYDYEKTPTITYSLDSNTKTFTGLITQSNPTTASTTLGSSYSQLIFPTIGYEFDTISVVMDGEDITDEVYNENMNKVTIPCVEGDVTISTTTKTNSEAKTYKPSTTLPDGYAEMTIDENTDIALNGYTLNPGYNISTSSTVLNIEFVLPTDYTLDTTYTVMPIVPEQLNFNSGINQAYGTSSSSSDGYAGSYSVINDSTMIGKFPLWNITHWDGNNYFVFSLPIAVVGTTLEEVKAWLANNNIVIYYPININANTL